MGELDLQRRAQSAPMVKTTGPEGDLTRMLRRAMQERQRSSLRRALRDAARVTGYMALDDASALADLAAPEVDPHLAVAQSDVLVERMQDPDVRSVVMLALWLMRFNVDSPARTQRVDEGLGE